MDSQDATSFCDSGFFKSLVENSIDCVNILDRSGRLRFVNRHGLELMEIADFAQFQDRPWIELWPEEEAGPVSAALATALAGGSVRLTANCPTINGRPKTWDVVITPLCDDAGAMVGVIAVSRDITAITLERQAIRDRDRDMRRQAAMLRSAGRVAGLGGWEVDRRTGKMFLSAELCSLLQQPPRAPMDIEVALNLCAPEHRETARAGFLGSLDDGGRIAFETQMLLPRGGAIWLRVLGEHAYENGECVAFRGAAQDITEERAARARLEQSERAANESSAAKTAFLATMGHEIRTPLNGVLGMAQAMARDALDDVQRRRLDVISEAGATLLGLLNDLLDVSKMEAGCLELEDGAVDFQVVVRGVHDAMTMLAAGKDLALTFDLCPTIHGLWRGDPGRIRQILNNLVSNAVKFTPRGWVHVSITQSDGDIVLRIADTGPGIPDDLAPRLFQKFAQADASTTRKFGGSGLGLSICRELVELMGGVITAESRPQAGALFSVRLPLVRVTEPQAAAPAAVDTVLAPDRPLRILAAEDNAMNQLVLKTLLAQVGIEPTVVADGQLALAAWRETDWDLILMDVQMPVMDGPSATRAIRADEAAMGRGRTPILALTANAMAHQVQGYLDCGMDAVVAKPIAFGSLLAAMQAALDDAADTADAADQTAAIAL